MKSQLTSLGNGLLSATTVMRRITSLGGGLLLLAAFGSTACQDSNAPESQDTENIGDNEFGVNFEALGFNHPTCTGADTLASPPVYVASTKTLNLALVPSNDDRQRRRRQDQGQRLPVQDPPRPSGCHIRHVRSGRRHRADLDERQQDQHHGE